MGAGDLNQWYTVIGEKFQYLFYHFNISILISQFAFLEKFQFVVIIALGTTDKYFIFRKLK